MYRVTKKNGEILNVESPHKLPDPTAIELVEEPYVKATIVTPIEGMDALCELSKSRRGEFTKMDYLG